MAHLYPPGEIEQECLVPWSLCHCHRSALFNYSSYVLPMFQIIFNLSNGSFTITVLL